MPMTFEEFSKHYNERFEKVREPQDPAPDLEELYCGYIAILPFILGGEAEVTFEREPGRVRAYFKTAAAKATHPMSMDAFTEHCHDKLVDMGESSDALADRMEALYDFYLEMNDLFEKNGAEIVIKKVPGKLETYFGAPKNKKPHAP